MKHFDFIDEHGSFQIKQPENISYLYFPLASEAGLKSAVTPSLGGDAKLNQETFLLEPVSSENLHNNRSGRSFWFAGDDSRAYCVSGTSSEQEAAKFSAMQDESELTAGFMWQTLKRTSRSLSLTTTVTSFIPQDSKAELMYVTVLNESTKTQELTPYAAIPIYGRSADNVRDHRNVTSMLHRIQTTENGVLTCPTMSFDERGHRSNKQIYYVIGCTGSSQAPERFYPTVEDFIGEGGSYTHPRAVYEQYEGVPAFYETGGKEAMGAFRFKTLSLAPGEKADYIILLGVADSGEEISKTFLQYNTTDKLQKALAKTKAFWQEQVNVRFHTGEKDFDQLMKWISFQPFLRRLFGCSFLPHHDYGRGGRGWRDLWQDCLSLLLMDPHGVGAMIAKNYAGVRVDGTNATIIGEGDGNFLADRNGIARLWMDHAFWPLLTTKLYIDQTGDIELLNKQVPYFKDSQTMRSSKVDTLWTQEYGNQQRTAAQDIYTGSILEHLLIQQLTAFYDVGEHNIYRLHDADWNDALDMAKERGESVAFTCAYAGNLTELSTMMELLSEKSGVQTVELMEEAAILLNDDRNLYEDAQQKRRLLSDYTTCCRHQVSGKKLRFSLTELAANLRQKAAWLTKHLQRQEWIDENDDKGWFNSYYDNHGRVVEGFYEGHVRMMLTGQVFAIMGHVATDSHIRRMVKSADDYLYQKEIGGYRLNTNFHELKLDMGRMFGFSYGEKENGAVFSHMAVMYANALYRRGFAREGFRALKALADTALDFDTSHIYPGIPEYFRSDGRGMYHYLTGAASWFLLTMLTEVFGVRGSMGDLILYPKLLAEQFDHSDLAIVCATFADRRFEIVYENKGRKDFGSYVLASAVCDNTPLAITDGTHAILPRTLLCKLSRDVHRIYITLT